MGDSAQIHTFGQFKFSPQAHCFTLFFGKRWGRGGERIGKGGPQKPRPGVTHWPKPEGGKGAPKIAPWPPACSHIPAQARIRNRNISGGGGRSRRASQEGFRCPFQGGQFSRRKLQSPDSWAGQARAEAAEGQGLCSRVLTLELPGEPHLGRPCKVEFGQFGHFQIILQTPTEDSEEGALAVLFPQGLGRQRPLLHLMGPAQSWLVP